MLEEMEQSIGPAEVDAVTRLADEAADMQSDALHALMSAAGTVPTPPLISDM